MNNHVPDYRAKVKVTLVGTVEFDKSDIEPGDSPEDAAIELIQRAAMEMIDWEATVTASAAASAADPFAGIVDVPTNDGWDA